jgi:hypothetical protein
MKERGILSKRGSIRALSAEAKDFLSNVASFDFLVWLAALVGAAVIVWSFVEMGKRYH